MHIRQKHAEWANVCHVPSLIEKREQTIPDQEVRHATAFPVIERHSGGTGKPSLVQNPVPLDVSIEIDAVMRPSPLLAPGFLRQSPEQI
jgi:hypothetical protein